ncbi:rRNA maturation RNase YbeY [Bacillus shivajii]|uniref:rRNA maturation RNase YbeY n=1 Tax=Bacillus shivajii TaxID=1983719 RepID=UPI001CFAC4CC|nr:rRNA maturation RNase YbeY [Bacillus shivajii]UCZ55264.1 rRNA maturation RNase YbeY [Bacillus shivajii]
MVKVVKEVMMTAMEIEEVSDNAEVSLTFVDNDTIHELNKTYRDKDQPTDVLSFALNEGEEDVVGEGMPELLGDVIVSVPRAEEQAEEYGHDMKRELCFLSVHGFLHLIGYDHETKEEEEAMNKRQEMILQKHGIKK